MKEYRTVNNTYKYLAFIYVITCSIAFISKIGKIYPSPVIQYVIFGFWIGLAFLKLIKNKFKIYESDLPIKHFFLIFIIPKIVVHAYSIMLYIIGKTNYITTNFRSYLVVFAVFSIIYIFKKKAFNYTIISAILSFLIVITYNISAFGINTIPDTLRFIITGNEIYDSSARLYEVHDYTFAIGYIILYYILIKKGVTKKELIFTYLFSIFLMMGFKRIQILALGLILGYHILSKFIKNKYRLYNITSWMFILVAYGFIFTLSNNKFFEWLNILGVNTMGRTYYYKVIIDLCDFNPLFLGLGRNAVSLILGQEYAYLNVLGVHSDILKYFAECGFVLFGIWMWYFFIKVVKWLKNKYTFNTVTTYYILTLYSFIIYYTDNIDTYFISQYIYMMICCIVAIKSSQCKSCNK